MAHGIQLGVRLGLSRPVAKRLAGLRAPERIQDFVNAIPWNHEIDGPTAHSVAVTLELRRAHCVEAAFVAACALWMAGGPPLVMDMGAAAGDVDHVVALFRRRGLWGAISKSNSPLLRYRDPIHRTLRELAMSYFPQYVQGRAKTLRTYSVPVDLRRYDPRSWVTHADFCHAVVDSLTAARHYELLPAGPPLRLRPIDPIEDRANQLKEFPAPGGRGTPQPNGPG